MRPASADCLTAPEEWTEIKFQFEREIFHVIGRCLLDDSWPNCPPGTQLNKNEQTNCQWPRQTGPTRFSQSSRLLLVAWCCLPPPRRWWPPWLRPPWSHRRPVRVTGLHQSLLDASRLRSVSPCWQNVSGKRIVSHCQWHCYNCRLHSLFMLFFLLISI